MTDVIVVGLGADGSAAAAQLAKRGAAVVGLEEHNVLGTGRRMFPAGVHASLRLTDSATTSKGVVIAIYEPARKSKRGA